MFKILRFFKNTYLLSRRLSDEESRWKAEGYSIRSEQAGPEREITYVEGGREIGVVMDFVNWMNDVVLFTDSLRNWSRPEKQPLSELEFEKVVNRLTRYFLCWGGEVTFDQRTLPTPEDFKQELEKAGIPYEELPGGIIHYSVDIDEERKRKGGFFDR